jgi:hypothetical protein
MYIGANYIKPYQKRSVQIQQIKATLRYNAHRPTLEGAKGARQLFGWDGELDKNQAYEMIDEAEKGTRYWRFIQFDQSCLTDNQDDRGHQTRI